MKGLNRIIWLVPLLVMLVLLGACGGEATPVETQPDDGFVLSLPRLVIDVDSAGTPSIAGLDPETLKAVTFGQLDLTGFQVPTEYVDWFTAADMQHLELVHSSDGIHAFVNGTPMPYVGWTGDSLGSVGDVASTLGFINEPTARIVKLLIPFVQRLGVDVAVRFPRTPDAPEIALRDPEAPLAAPASEEAGPTIALAKVHMNFDENGVPSVLSVSTRDLESALGVSMRQAELPPATIQQMMDAGIQHLTLRMLPNGMYIWVNDNPLPNVVWSDQYLQNASDVYGQLYYTPAYETVRTAVASLLPFINNIDGEVVLMFPHPGVDAIPIPNR
ncbi:MAG: hypothetical protein J5I90_19470 [Caldilineales bacterium]|nr:hypothetical protein [Caldilineales bacterium]